MGQMNPRKETTKVMNLLQRPSAKVTSSETLLGELTASLTAERKKDTDAVDAQKKVVKAAEKVYQDADANRVAKANLHDQAKGRTATAKAVVAHEQSEYTKAQKIRDADLATIAKAKALIEELIKTENAHLAGPSSELLQLNRKSAATQKIRSMIVAMKQDVDDEEMMQKSILDEEELKYNVVTMEHAVGKRSSCSRVATVSTLHSARPASAAR